jgi:hypothetical protein
MAAFIERSRLGKVFYQLTGSRLSVSGTRGLRPFSLELDLTEISPNIQRIRGRFLPSVLLFYGIGFGLLIVTAELFRLKWAPFDAVFWPAEITLMFSVSFLSIGYRWSSRLQAVRFRNILGKTVFDMVKERGYADEFEAFVEELQENIRRSKVLDREFQPVASAPPEIPAPRENWWKASLILGILSAGLPRSKVFVETTANFEFFIIFPCSVGGLALCVCSFLKKERWRFLSLFGAILAVLPALLY